MDMLELSGRVVVIFVVLYGLARTLNKKLISQMTFFDFVAGITLGSMTATITFNTNLEFWKGLLALVLFAVLVFLIEMATLKSFKARKIFNSEPTILINNGQILEDGMAKVRMNVDELLFQLRKKNFFYLSDVDSAVLETDGTVSVLPKTSAQPATKSDVNISQLSRNIPQTFIIQGNVLEHSLKAAGKDKAWVKQLMNQWGINKLEDIIVAQVDQLGGVYIDTKTDVISFAGDE
ncbi:DUF421 domain-containing protein [Thalassobacillus pellis]|uniref:DUF421 domain-containing protein n=1 Tax=Thalassobacillus pellis TaxID=748008 RepID=UPI00195FEE15|nr:DUF421 domain-containing protein [Thalassobacillus pellis]MBM7554199.1 uncharacterized membrane protein YcaP (DUF421 family) [Thalassobacillus pellis]